jgi:hypothetical protein
LLIPKKQKANICKMSTYNSFVSFFSLILRIERNK